jgi:restriction endonuclease S subunit
MSPAFPAVPLRSIVRRAEEPVAVEPDRAYKQVTVRLFHKGVVLRGQLPGSEIRTARQWRVRSGQVLLSRIDARNGAIGLVPPELDGAIVTNDFWAFDVDANQADPRFLDAYFRTCEFVEACKRASEGTTNRVRLQPDRFLDIQVPLPGLPEQRRIVALIEEAAAKIQDAVGLRRQGLELTDELSRAAITETYRALLQKWGTVRLDEISASITDGDHQTPLFLEKGVRFIFVGNVSSAYLHFSGCRYVAPDYYLKIDPSRKPTRGDILYTAVGATLGVPAVVDVDEPFCFQRHVALVKPDRAKVLPRFLWYMLRSRSVYERAWAVKTGSAQPTVPLRAIRAFEIPVADVPAQGRTVAYLDKLELAANELRRGQMRSASELAALLRSFLDRAFRGSPRHMSAQHSTSSLGSDWRRDPH